MGLYGLSLLLMLLLAFFTYRNCSGGLVAAGLLLLSLIVISQVMAAIFAGGMSVLEVSHSLTQRASQPSSQPANHLLISAVCVYTHIHTRTRMHTRARARMHTQTKKSPHAPRRQRGARACSVTPAGVRRPAPSPQALPCLAPHARTCGRPSPHAHRRTAATTLSAS